MDCSVGVALVGTGTPEKTVPPSFQHSLCRGELEPNLTRTPVLQQELPGPHYW